MKTKNFLNLLISCFISLFMFVSVFCLFINKFIVPTESKALSTSEITDSITNLKNTRYPDGWSWHNEYSDTEATKIFNGSQCVGFARNLGNIIFGSFPNQGVLNFSTGQILNGWTAIRGNDVTYVQPGDIIHVAGHAAMVYYLSGETIYVAEAWGSQNSIVKYGLFNGNWQGRGSTLAKLKSNYDFQGVWRYNGTATPNPNLTSNITISGQTIPPNVLKKGSFFGIYGNIKSNLPITLVWGGVYKNDWTVTSQYAEAKPNATSYSLYPYFDNKIVFNGLEEGTYHYLIKARDTSGTEYELINSEFIIGNPNEDPVKISVSSNSINLNMSDRKSATITVSYSGGNNIPNGGMRMYNTTNAQKYVSWKTSASGKTTSVTFTALKEGTVDIVFGFANRDTDEIIAEERITINISGNLEFKSSATSISLNKSKGEKNK